MTNDRLFTVRDGHFSVGYDDPDNTPGRMGGWFIMLSGPGLTAEYPVSEDVATEIIDDFDLEEKED